MLNKKISSNFNEHILCSNAAHAHSIVSLISGIDNNWTYNVDSSLLHGLLPVASHSSPLSAPGVSW